MRKYLGCIFLFLAVLCAGQQSALFAQGIITTVVGNGSAGFGGDNPVLAIEAQMSNPSGVAVDGAGNIFIVDTGNNRIRKIDVNGNITTIAGNGQAGFSGDGGPATQASLNSPVGIALDAAGNLYISDKENNRARRISVEGVISTIAGNGDTVFAGDGGLAVEASLASPLGIAVDGAGNVFVTDVTNHRVRKINPEGIITTVAGNGGANFGPDGGLATETSVADPEGVFVDENGNIFIADTRAHKVRKVGVDGVITTIAGNGDSGITGEANGDGGLAVDAAIGFPIGVFANNGNVYIVDQLKHVVRKVDADGIITTVAGNGRGGGVVGEGFGGDGGPATDAFLALPSGVFVDGAENIFIADSVNNRIRKVNAEGIITTVAGNGVEGFGGDGLAIDASVNEPESIAIDNAGNIYVADTKNNRVRKVDANGMVTTVAGSGRAEFGGDGGPAVEASLNFPRSVYVDGAGNIFIADNFNHRIRKVDTEGIITTVAGNGGAGLGSDGGLAVDTSLLDPEGVFVDSEGNIFIAEPRAHVVRKVGLDGIIRAFAGSGNSGVAGNISGNGGLAVNADLGFPISVHGDSSGNIYIADQTGHVIRKVNEGGIISTVAGTGNGGGIVGEGFGGDGGLAKDAFLALPSGVFADESGNVFIGDSQNHRIRVVGGNGVINTIAGNGTPGFGGDGGLAIEAMLAFPGGVAVDQNGNIFIADTNNNRIRKVEGGEVPTAATPASIVLNDSQISVPLPFDRLAIRCRSVLAKVLNSDGEPIAGVNVSAESADENIVFIPQASARSNSVGNTVFSVCGLSPGETDVVFTAEPGLREVMRVIVNEEE